MFLIMSISIGLVPYLSINDYGVLLSYRLSHLHVAQPLSESRMNPVTFPPCNRSSFGLAKTLSIYTMTMFILLA